MYGYGYRYNSGLVLGAGGGGGGFSNTYSTSFDGVDDYASTGLDLSFATVPNFSISYWIKTDATLTNFASYFPIGVNVSYSNAAYNYAAGRLYKTGAGLVVYIQGSGSSSGSTALNDGNWHYIVQTYSDNGNNTSRVRIYVDGNTTPEADLASTLSYAPLTSNLFIGARNASSDRAFPGNVDEVSVWDSVLSTEEITALYNSGTPTDLTSLSPIAWYRMGDNGSWKSPQFLLPNNENKDKISNYSFDLDGIDDYIDLGNDSSLDIFGSDFTISLWAKWGAQTSNSNGLINFAANTNKAVITLGFGSQYGKISFGTGSSSTVGILYDCGSGYNDDNWHHIMCTLQGSTRTIYVDGVDISSTGSVSSIGVGSNNDIGNRARSRYFVGNIDEVSIFDSIVPIGNLWDGSGEPTTISGAVAHWRMGEESTFSGGVWTVPDAIGSNDGTSNAMTIEDRVGDAPNSTSNSVSYNMDEVDRVEDTP